YYNALLSDASDTSIETRELENGRIQTTSGNKRVAIEAVSLLDEAGQAVDTLSVGQKARFRVDVLANSAVDTLVLGFSIKDRVGQTMHGTNTYYSDQVIENVK